MKDNEWMNYPIIRVIPSSDPIIALTFDDGPDQEYTPKVLDIVKQYGVSATFFCLGSQVVKNPHVAVQLVEDGHQIANHTWTHPHAADVSTSELLREIAKTADIIETITTIRTRWFRPPFGEITKAQLSAIVEWGYQVVLWTVDSLDWSGLTGPQIVERVLPSLANGVILLSHCAGNVNGILDALPHLIEAALDMGYRFVRLDEV